MKPLIITLSGSARHGKDATIQLIIDKLELQNKKCLHINYADYLKYLCKSYFNWDGEKDKNGRTLLQFIGTEKIRSKNPNFWVDSVINLIDVIGNEYDYILIGDCRFKNEVYRWVTEGYKILTIHVERLNFDNGLTEEQKKHPSENGLNDFVFDKYLKAENLNELENEIDIKLKNLFKK